MFRLYFVRPDQSVAYVPCVSVEEAKEGKYHLPPGSYFCIETPDGDVVDHAPEFENAVNVIQHLRLVFKLNSDL
jgi:hypothetical protein